MYLYGAIFMIAIFTGVETEADTHEISDRKPLDPQNENGLSTADRS